MSLPTTTRAWIFQNPITDAIDLSPNSPKATFVLKELPLPSPLPASSDVVHLQRPRVPPLRPGGRWSGQPLPQEDSGRREGRSDEERRGLTSAQSRQRWPGRHQGGRNRSGGLLLVRVRSSQESRSHSRAACPVQLQRRSLIDFRRSLGKSRASGRRVRSVLLVSLGYPHTSVSLIRSIPRRQTQ